MTHVASLCQVGIRSLRSTEVMHRDLVADGNRVVTMDEFRLYGAPIVVETLPKDGACYVSIDIDVLDLSLVPGCVSAEPDGMTYRELRDLLTAIAERTNVTGFDLVEMNPQLDVASGVTAYLAAHIVVDFLGRICDQPRWIEQSQHRARERAARRQAGGEHHG